MNFLRGCYVQFFFFSRYSRMNILINKATERLLYCTNTHNFYKNLYTNKFLSHDILGAFQFF